MKLELNKKQLQIIAIIAMVIDHFSWGFLDFYSVSGQILHVIGRLTIPIMCFFIAEGYRKTSNLRKYILRLVVFWIITVIPFYLFFHEEYYYRQSIFLDLLLGLLVLVITDSKKLVKWQKIALTTIVVLISITVGGWPILPMVYIAIFYYGKDFKQTTKWFCSFTVFFVLFMAALIALNQVYHFSKYEWLWWDKAYFLGFMLALPLLKCYNGKKSKNPLPRYFFYAFYPCHFLVLFSFKAFYAMGGIQYVYILMHVYTIIFATFVLYRVLKSKPSRPQVSLVFLLCFAIMYLVGFLIEITTSDINVIISAIKVEYFGECMVFVGMTWFMASFFRINVNKLIYLLETLISFLLAIIIFTTEHHNIFYESISISTDGPFPRAQLTYGIGFYLMIVYLAVICIALFIVGIMILKRSSGLERRRILWILPGLCCPWFVTLLRTLGLTGGYEISSIGIIGVGFCFLEGLIRYGYFDSAQAACENALRNRREAIMTINLRHYITYVNSYMKELFPHVKEGDDAYKNKKLEALLTGKEKYYEVGKTIYEMKVEELKEADYLQGYIMWSIDVTEHFNNMNKIKFLAETDSLTGLYNRKFYQDTIAELLESGKSGSMFMLDVDNFKCVNDTYGHTVGDKVLIAVSDAIKSVANYSIIPCRIGGDEFNLFVEDIVDIFNNSRIAENIVNNLKKYLKDANLPDDITVSIGISTTEDIGITDHKDFNQMYSNSDKALYLAKNQGKNQYHMFK